MYSRQEASSLTEEFWTAFGRYMSPVLSADGEKINWVNYKTGEKNIRFVMAADNKSAKISIIIYHRDTVLQELYFYKLAERKKIFHHLTGEEWKWRDLKLQEDGKVISEVSTTLHKVNVLKKADWPAIISFLKPRIIALDAFWCEYKYDFDNFI